MVFPTSSLLQRALPLLFSLCFARIHTADAPLIAIPAAHVLLQPNTTWLRYYSDIHSPCCQISALSDLGTSTQTGLSPLGNDSAPLMMSGETILHQWVLLGDEYLWADPQNTLPHVPWGPAPAGTCSACDYVQEVRGLMIIGWEV
ncbi:hypothetical protein B0H13DRAFT_2316555 [Mycena leptocephala]|nr:hypothetical protein B0H13DRAFT_2316555 [Mycena leptocephala]